VVGVPVFFSTSICSSLRTNQLLRKDRGPEVSEEAAMAQREAVGKYTELHESVLDYLKISISRRQGSNDVIVPTVNSYILQQNLPNAQLILYPDSNHGSFYQYPELFVSQADEFLTSGLQGG
jgi:pimeloyl-ACP methyl ester carboxylesterase